MRRQKDKRYLQEMPQLPLQVEQFEMLFTPKDYKLKLLTLIKSAKRRIYMSALYWQNDQAGQELMHELYQAKQRNPDLDVHVFVDFHRAQRGLIGQEHSLGNAEFYRDCQKHYPLPINIYGVPVKSKELLGVLHLKGFIFDDTVIFSGSSINDIYLHQEQRYRYDRYHLFIQPDLANSMVLFLQTYFISAEAVIRLTDQPITAVKQMKKAVLKLKRSLSNATYQLKPEQNTVENQAQITITPLVGLGFRGNNLNKTIRSLIRTTEKKLIILTPYFNPPMVLIRDIRRLLKQGKQIIIIIGDKTANDFYIPPDQPFTTIGGLPYIYESNLRRFVQSHQKYIKKQLLHVHLWHHDNNSFHLKGISADDQLHLITGNNLNPRAWRLDLENGLLIQDKQQHLKSIFDQELNLILTHTQRIQHFQELETLNDYPLQVKKLLRTIKRTKIESIIKNLL